MLLKKPFVSSSLPLVLDLDGTLIRTDTFHEMMVYLLLRKPWELLWLPFWLLKGRAFAKARLMESCDFSPQHLPYNPQLLAFAKEEAQKGRPLILATGTDQRAAQKIADHLDLFQEVIGSNGHINMTGLYKQQALLDRFGVKGFDYAGDSSIDIYIWQVAHKAIVVHPKWRVLKQAWALKGAANTHYFPRERHRFLAFFMALRPLFWLPNLLTSSASFFIAISFLSSGVLIAGDLFTLSKERKESFKKSVFAEGHLHLITAFILSPFLILFSFLLILLFTPEGAWFSLLYIPLLSGLDIHTRSLSQGFRWSLLGIFQLLTLLTIHSVNT